MRRLRTPKDCCRTTLSQDGEGQWCGECGQPLVRCMAFAECAGLVGADGQCSTCVDPHLIIEPGATMHAPVGGAVALPFLLMNASPKDRPLFINGLWSREDGGDWHKERLGWEELNPQERAPASVVARAINKPGMHEIEIMFAVATRYKQREERFAFSTRVILTVKDESNAAGPTIQISSENEMNGNVIQIHDLSSGGESNGKVIEAIDMHVRRLDREESSLGLRGMQGKLHVRRSAAFKFSGFPKEDHSTSGLPIMTEDGALAFGRERSREEGGASDVRILAAGPDGKVDRELSVLISRRHFDIFVENDCLVLRVRGRNGLRVNDRPLASDERIILNDGDRIEPLLDQPRMLSVTVKFEREHRRVTGVVLIRKPQLETTFQ
ncbi:MAG: FHA domain-containing protein [Pseudomonadota bacterium]